MKTLREYLDQLDEISRRDFLKTAGGAALAAAMPMQALGQILLHPATGRGHEDPPLEKIPALTPRWEWPAQVTDLTKADQQNIVTLINILYLAREAGERAIAQQALSLLNGLNRTYLGINLPGAMIETQRQIQSIQAQAPEKIRGAQQYFLTPEVTRRIFFQVDRMISNPGGDRSRLPRDVARHPPGHGSEAIGTGDSQPADSFESKLLDNGLVLYVYASRQNHESQSAIKAALNRLAQRTGAAERINQRLREISADPGRYGASTRPDQYFQQVNQIIRNIDELGAR